MVNKLITMTVVTSHPEKRFAPKAVQEHTPLKVIQSIKISRKELETH